jgi:phospholipid-translocating ATPase
MRGEKTNRASIFETHYKATLVMCSFFVTTLGWFAWIAFLDGIYAPTPSGPYAIKHTFRDAWGKDIVWWSTVFIVLAFLGLMELSGKTIKRQMLVAGLWQWPPWKKGRLRESVEEWDLELWQELEQDPVMRERLRILAQDEDCLDDEGDEDAEAEADDEVTRRA